MAEVGQSLSERELEVLHCLAEGKSNQDIASELMISLNTVKVHVRNILTKLGATSRTEAMTLALKQGLVTLSGVAISSMSGEDDPPAAQESEPLPTTKVVRLNRSGWLMGGLIVLIGLGGVLLTLFWPRPEPVSPAPTESLFVETPIANSNWLIARPMPIPRSQAAIATVGLKLYLIGGQTPAISGDVAIYDTQGRIWESGAAKLTAVSGAGAGVLAGEIYVVGGQQANGQATAVVEVYSPLNNAWRPATSLPRPVSGGLVVSDGSYIYLAGGRSGDDYLDSFYRFDPAAQIWEMLPSLPSRRAMAVGGFMAGQLYVVGGFDGQQELASCEQFDPAGAVWRSCPAMSQNRAASGAAVLLNKLYVFGGEQGNFGEVYDITAASWSKIELPISTWTYPAVANVETRIYVLGGIRQGQLVAENYVYTPLIYQFFIPAAAGGNP